MKVNIGILTLSASFIFSIPVNASAVEVCYVPVRGDGLMSCVAEFDAAGNMVAPCSHALGRFSLVLEKISQTPGSRTLRLSGPATANIYTDGSMDHVMLDYEARGLLYSFEDRIVESTTVSDCLIQAREVLNITLGTGDYAGARGIVNILLDMNPCTGVNVFDVARNEGEICFSTNN